MVIELPYAIFGELSFYFLKVILMLRILLGLSLRVHRFHCKS